MAQTTFGVNHPLSNKVWAKELAHEAIRKTFFARFVGKGKDTLITRKDDLKKAAGDQITCGLRVQLQGDGIQGDATLEGNEEALSFYDDSLVINQLRHATRTKGKMTEQRVPYNLREDSRDGLVDWWADRLDTCFANQICGNTAVTDTRFTGNNAVLAPSANRIIRAGNRSDDQSILASDIMTLDLIDIARERAETFSIRNGTGAVMRPLKYMGGDYYVMFLHDYQVTSIRTNIGTGQWQDIQKAAMQGGDVESNPIFTGALGVYNGVVLHKWNRITTGVNSSTNAAETDVRRAVFCGAQAAMVAFGGDNGPSSFSWSEEMFDYGNQLGVKAGSIFGLKKSKYVPDDDSTTNAEDFGTLVVSTYATQTNPS